MSAAANNNEYDQLLREATRLASAKLNRRVEIEPDEVQDLAKQLRATMAAKLPKSIEDAWALYCEQADTLNSERNAPHALHQGRCVLLESLEWLVENAAAATLGDILARLEWMRWIQGIGSGDNRELVDRVIDDVRRFGVRCGEKVPAVPRHYIDEEDRRALSN